MNIAKRYELIEIDKIVPSATNPKIHDKKQIAQIRASFREFGVISPCVIDEEYNLLVGHGRLEAARQEGMKEINCVVVEGLTEAQKKGYLLVDNKLTENSPWDEELLMLSISELEGMDFDLDILGFDVADLDKLLNGESEVEEDNFDVEEELTKPTFSKMGDLWLLGHHRVICGDATRQETYEKLMDDKLVNLVVTDPPYNVNYDGSAGKIKNDNLKDEAFYNFLYDAFSCMEKVMTQDASIYVFHADTEGLNFRKAFQKAGFYLSGTCIWKKQSLVLGRSPYQWQHEPILYGWKKIGKHQWYTGRKESTIWSFDKPKKNGEHPTMKPISLLTYPITNSSMSNCIVLDAFGGSGSTLIACEQTNRICHMIELDEKFVDVIVNRYIEQVGTSENVSVIRDGKAYKYSEVTAHA